MRVLLIDNHDSFTFNLFHLIAEVTGVEPTVVRNDEVGWADLPLDRFDAAVISPGPGRPERDRDVGISTAVIAESDLPVLGVCLGHQALCHILGARVEHAPEPQHGRVSRITHVGTGLFAGVPSPFQAVRYHSLAVREVTGDLEPIAWAPDGTVMAVRHRYARRWGVQFHPESILTEHGRTVLANFRRLVGDHHPDPAEAPRTSPAVGGHHRRTRLRVRELDLDVDTAGIFVALYGRSPTAFWLDSATHEQDGTHPRSRFSFLGDASGPLAERVTYDVTSRAVTVRRRGRRDTEPGPLLEWLDRSLRLREVEGPELPFDLNLGYVGYLGYELKAECDGAAAHEADTPDAALVLADRMIAVDHHERNVHLLALDDGENGAEAEGWLDDTEAVLRSAPRAPRVPIPAGGTHHGLPVDFRHPPDAYLDLIAACQRAIRDGESYEICLTNELTVPRRVDPLATYLAYRQSNPAPFAAYLRHGDNAVLSASPERFLRVHRDGTVETRPIKGTAPRSDDPIADGRLAAELRASEKERAENLMIVDLSRHDLGSVCEIGSVDVPELFIVESYATVHQLVSTVRGRLREGLGALDAIRAAFPGGSMTGAPKQRTMELIDQLEGGPRGVYSGAIGYLAFNGAADLSIVIRTMVAQGDTVRVGIGGAIVALSDPQAELRESLLKGRAALSALAATAERRSSPEPVVPIR
jgi:para-aminobenzoate synthetase